MRGEPAAEGRGTQGRRQRAAQHAHGQRRGERGHELELDRRRAPGRRRSAPRPLRATARARAPRAPRRRASPGRPCGPRARRGSRGRGASEARRRRRRIPAAPPRRAPASALRRDPAPAQRRERAREGGGHRRARRALGEAQAGSPLSASSRAASSASWPLVQGREPAAEQDGLGQRAREVERLHRVEAGEGTTGRGEPARQLDGGRERRREEDEGAQGHAARRF